MSDPTLRLKPVEWRDGLYSSYEAYIGPVLVGRVNWTMRRNDPTPWYASTVFTTTDKGFVTRDEAKANVEARVFAFVRRLVEVAP